MKALQTCTTQIQRIMTDELRQNLERHKTVDIDQGI